ncbi:Dockerin type I repeat protein [Allorhodopirellula heiligendammensis]|uniref:Dockerin type I repeat protein n=2 Tax=Allorhodopirellula heiligendammensis TaxID=2714739 RepID=A0A5C6BUH6_9BACT|nr:Dockerin type I repeat protein [Allorhodopirellula heiligendammensis]
MAVGVPLGATPQDTAEFMLGTVTVTPIFLESDGSIDPQSQNWTPAEIDSVLANITAGAEWWSDLLDTFDSVHSLSFTIDDTFARNPVETGYEPIDRPSNYYNRYVGQFLDAAGVDPSLQLDDGMLAFNDSQREKFGTDWAFSLFITDSSDDPDGYFGEGGSFRGAFAFPGGRYIVSPSTRPVSTFAHEMGHIFWAFDEYSGGGSYDETRGYYNSPNTNARNNPTPGFQQEVSIMADYDRLITAFATHTTAASTLAVIGWQDSDGDGIFDVLDVPLHLSGSGVFNAETSRFEFNGEASVGTLRNQNASGNQSDITINRISSLDVSIDGGQWVSVAAPDTYTATFNLALSVPRNFSKIEFRVRDAETGITSDIWSATPTTPLLPDSSSLSGYAVLDTGDNSNRASGEPLLSDVAIHVTAADGSELPQGEFDAADAALDTQLPTVSGITLSGNLGALKTTAQVRRVAELNNTPMLHVHDSQLQYWTPNLGDRVTALATLTTPTAQVDVDVVGLTSNGTAYARVEAYDAAGNLIDRATTDLRNNSDGGLGFGERQTLTLHDSDGRIASIRIMGHADTEIGATAIRTGVPSNWTTDAHGAFVLSDLPSGSYRLTATSDNVTYGFDPITVSSTTNTPIRLVAKTVDSPRYNPVLAADVNQDNVVTAVDALQVINYLNTFGSHTLTHADATGSKIDVTNDGVITALDALRVINYLNGGQTASASEPLPIASQPDTTRELVTAEKAAPDPVGIDDVLTEPIQWIAPQPDDPDDEPFTFRIV